MTKTLSCVLLTCLLLAAGAVLRARAAQDRTAQPGQPTQGKVWIQNHGDAEAVPVSIQSVAPEAPPLRVQIVGASTGATTASEQVRSTRQQWEYQVVTLPSGQAPPAVLNAAGADGWEATGMTATQGGTLVVMKRPR